MTKPYDKDYRPTEAGIFKIPEAEYRKIKAANITYLKLFNRSPLHVWTAFNDPEAEIIGATYAMVQGTAFHWSVLEPDRLKTDVTIDPGWSKNATKYKEWAAEQGDFGRHGRTREARRGGRGRSGGGVGGGSERKCHGGVDPVVGYTLLEARSREEEESRLAQRAKAQNAPSREDARRGVFCDSGAARGHHESIPPRRPPVAPSRCPRTPRPRAGGGRPVPPAGGSGGRC